MLRNMVNILPKKDMFEVVFFWDTEGPKIIKTHRTQSLWFTLPTPEVEPGHMRENRDSRFKGDMGETVKQEMREAGLTKSTKDRSARTEEWLGWKNKGPQVYLWSSNPWKIFILVTDYIPKVKYNAAQTDTLLQVKGAITDYGHMVIDCTSPPSRSHGCN